MKILFIHPNIPGQYKHLARVFGADPENKVVFITERKDDREIPGVTKIIYKSSRPVYP